MTSETLMAQRQGLALALALAYCDDGAFPGSRQARAYSQALMALAAFDAAHPDVLAAVRGMSDAADRALRGED